jgi:hypothetical protein
MPDTTVATERTPQDYTIEHAEYMAKGAEHLLAALNVEDALRLRQEESADVDADDMHAAGTTRAEAATGLRADIYAFRKRRARALLSRAVPAFDPTAKCSPTLTQCPRCKNPHHACDQHPVVAPVDERLGPLSDNNLCAQALLADADEVPDGTFLRYSFTVDQLRKFARALLAQQPSGDEALMRQALEELVDCPSRVGGYGKRSKVIAALRARLEGTK